MWQTWYRYRYHRYLEYHTVPGTPRDTLEYSEYHRLAFGKKYCVEVRLARVVVGFAFCIFFVDHVKDQLCDNDFASFTDRFDDAIARINEAFQWLNNKKKITAIDQFLIEIQVFLYCSQQSTKIITDTSTRISRPTNVETNER